MKTPKFLLSVAISLVALTSARAELVRLAFTDWKGSFTWRADSPDLSWDYSLGNISKLEIYYDPATAGTIEAGRTTFEFSDSVRNFWRFTITGPTGEDFTVSRPLASLFYTVGNYGYLNLYFLNWTHEPGDGYLDFSARIIAPVPPAGSLPVMPIEIDSDAAQINWVYGNYSWFPLAHLSEGYGAGEFETGSASVVPDIISPVPEPAMYGAAGAGVLMLALLRRLKQRTQDRGVERAVPSAF